jgi:hypothetical protein
LFVCGQYSGPNQNMQVVIFCSFQIQAFTSL